MPDGDFPGVFVDFPHFSLRQLFRRLTGCRRILMVSIVGDEWERKGEGDQNSCNGASFHGAFLFDK
jgi:hypothetical protein